MLTYLRQLTVFCVAACFGYVLYCFHVPIPFMLAALIVGVITVKIGDPWARWSMSYRNVGLMTVGYAIGSNITLATCQDFVDQIGMIALSALFMIVVGVLIAWLMAKIWHEDFMSCVLGMMPGGMSLVMVIVQEDKRYDPNVVMVMQVMRFFGVVFTLPFLVIALFDAHVGDVVRPAVANALAWPWFVPIVLTGVIFFLKFHIPIPWLLGPVIPTALVSIYYQPVGYLPQMLLWTAQVLVGVSMGTMLDLHRVWRAKRLLPAIITGTAFLIAASYVAARVIENWYGVDMITGFLAMSPGGISEMNIAGLSMGAHTPTILAYQLLRVFAISWAIQLIIKLEHKLMKHA